MIVAGLVVIAVLILGAIAAATGFDLGKALRDISGSMFPPAAATSQGRDIRGLYDIVFLIAVVIFVLVEGLIIWSVLRYRRKPGDDELPPQTHGNNVAEAIWTIVPTIIVMFLFFVSWQTLNTVDAVSKTPDIKVRAVAGQFQWSFVYVDQNGKDAFTQFTATGENGGLVLPVGRNVQVQLHSNDVIHAFYVPQFLFKRDVNPVADVPDGSKDNVFDFTIDPGEAGQTFRGQCAELCGIGHRIMTFEVHALTQDKYDAWYKAQVEAANASPSPGASAGPPAATLELSAKNIQFDKQSLEAPAGKPFDIAFDNQDNGVTHDVAIQDPGGKLIFNGEDAVSVSKKTYHVPPLQPGDYKFICTFHANMTGTLTVK